MFFRALFLILISFSISCAHNEKKTQKQAKYLLQIGTAHLSNGDNPQAIRYLQNSIIADDTNPVAYNNLALAYYFRQKYVLAEKNLKKALELAPKYTEAMNNYGRVLIDMRQYDKAISVLTKATEDLTYAMPEKSYSNLGYAYYKNKQYDEAYKFLRKSLSMRKNSCFTNTIYAHTLYEQKKYETAANAFFRNIHLCEKQAEMYQENKYHAAVAFLQINKYNEAVALLEELQANTSTENEKWRASSKELLQTLKR